MAQELIQLNMRKPWVRVLLLLFLLIAAVWSFYVVRWYAGNTMAEYFPSANNLEAASTAVSLAPDDPLTHWRMAQVSQRSLTLDQQAMIVKEYEKVVSLSPYDYRFWMSLGTAYGQQGEAVRAETALRRAVELAPNYAYPRWYLGNLLLRNGHYDPAFAELRKASEADPELRPQQFHLIWEVYGGDTEALKNAVGESFAVRAQFAQYLVGQNKIDEGLRLWNTLSNAEKRSSVETGEAIITSLIKAFRFHDGLTVWNEISGDNHGAVAGQIFDASFEKSATYTPNSVFGWQVKATPGVRIDVDPAKSHAGSHSLRMMFQVRSNMDPMNVSQLIPVIPMAEYDVEFFVSSDKLESASTPQIQIVNASDENIVLASSAAAPSGTKNWARFTLSFKTGENVQAVIIRIVRFSCSTKEAPVCPIFGTVWYDNFSLKRKN
jgi:tetratricopeptide (TPR) repeat protein